MNYKQIEHEMKDIVNIFTEHYKSDLDLDLPRIKDREPGGRFLWARAKSGTWLINLNTWDAAPLTIALRQNTGHKDRLVYIIRVGFDGGTTYDMENIDSLTFGRLVGAGFIPATMFDPGR